MTAHRAKQSWEEMRMVNHWSSSSAWHGRQQFYSWYLTFENCSELHELADYYDQTLVGLPLDIVPPRWLHLTLQSVSPADNASAADISRIAREAQARCASIPSFKISIDRALVHPEAVIMLVSPVESIGALRSSLREAIATVWGRAAVLDTESQAGESSAFVPHITLAYSRSDGPAAPIVDAVRSLDHRSVTVPVSEATLLLVNPDVPVYMWSPIATAALDQSIGQAAGHA